MPALAPGLGANLAVGFLSANGAGLDPVLNSGRTGRLGAESVPLRGGVLREAGFGARSAGATLGL